MNCISKEGAKIYLHLGKANQSDLETRGYIFEGYLVVADRLLLGKEAADFLGQRLRGNDISQVLEELNGSYFYIIKNNNLISFGVDHFGGGSLFYQLEPNFNIYDDPCGRVPNPSYSDEAFCCLLASGYTTGDETVYTHVRECASGVLYQYDLTTKSLCTKTWFKYNPRSLYEADPAVLEAAFFKFLPQLSHPDAFYFLPLSGGLDSRTILAVALKKKLPIRAFTYGLRTERDFLIAKRVCSELDIQHATYPITWSARDRYFDDAGFEEMVRSTYKGRSLPEEFDWLAMNHVARGNFVVCPGHTGDWLTGGHIDRRLLKIKSVEQLVHYIFVKHFSLTATSNRNFQNLIKNKIQQSLEEILTDNKGELVACAERWNLEHRQKKYIVNSVCKYNYMGFYAYLPFYEKGIMECFMNLKMEYKIHQYGYANVLKNRLFVGDLEKLKTIENTRISLQNELVNHFGHESLVGMMHQLAQTFDYKKYRKRIFKSSLKGYENPAAILSSNSTSDFLQQKVKEAFPLLNRCPSQLRDYRCHEASQHVEWVLEQRVAQMNVAGLYVCAFMPYILEAEVK